MGLFKKKCKENKFIFSVDNLDVFTKDFVNAKLDGVMTLRLIEKKDITIEKMDDYLYDTSLLRITPKMYEKALKLQQNDIMQIRILAGVMLESSLKELIGTYDFKYFNKNKGDVTRKALRKVQNFANNEGVIVDYVIQNVVH